MGKTADRLGERHPSRHHQTEIRLEDVIELLSRHFGTHRPHVQSGDVSRLIVAIGVARANEARCGEGHVSKKDSVASLRAMLRFSDEHLATALKNCDIVTFGRIQDAHFILMGEDVLVAAQRDEWAYTPGIKLPPGGDGPLCLPKGFEGLRQAIKVAIDQTTADASGSADGGIRGALDATESGRRPKVGNKEKPHLTELAMACVTFWGRYGPTEKQSWSMSSEEDYVSPRTAFAKGVFEIAGIRSRLAADGSSPEELGAVWIAELLRTPEAKISN